MTMVPVMSTLPSYPETWIAWHRASLQTIFMVWLSNSAPCGQFPWLFEILMLPMHVIFIDLQRTQYNEAQPHIRSGADLGSRRCNFPLKSMHLHCPHHLLMLHLPHACHKGKWKWKEPWIMFSNWVRQRAHETKGVSALQLTMTTTNGNSYKMHNSRLAESHPSVIWGNRILICVSSSGFISKCEGVMYCACLDKTINLWKAGLCADGFLSKVNKANIVIWMADLIEHNKPITTRPRGWRQLPRPRRSVIWRWKWKWLKTV